MSKPIYQLALGNKNLAGIQVWKALPEAQVKSLFDQEKASREAAGARAILFCDSSWADEMHHWWGVMRFPDLQARIDHTRRLDEMGWLDINDYFTLLGTSDSEPAEVTIPNPIYKLWILKYNPAAVQASRQPKGLEAAVFEKHDALYKQYGAQMVLYCDTYWCNEAYQGFGISAYPDIESNMKIMQGLSDLGWPGYIDSYSYLGIPFPPGERV
jgi:hypothetical protein